MQSNFFFAEDGQIGWGLWILSMAVIGVFAYRRGWRKTPDWLRLYIWCAVVVEALLLFAYLVNWYFKAGKAGPVMYDAGPLMYGYLVTVFVAQYVVIIGVVVAPILLVVLIVEGSRSAWSALVH
jgi:hypothetical protein